MIVILEIFFKETGGVLQDLKLSLGMGIVDCYYDKNHPSGSV